MVLLWFVMGCLPEDALQEPGWSSILRDPVNPVLGPMNTSPSLIPFEGGVSGAFVDVQTTEAVRDESDTGWSWSTPVPLADAVVSISHLEAPQGTLLFAERDDGVFRGDPGPDGVVWTDVGLADAHAPDVNRQGGAWWLAFHRDDGLYISRSDDGLLWSDPVTPVVQADPDLAWMSASVSEPALTLGPDGLWYLVFTGESEDGTTSMGAAVTGGAADPRRAVWRIHPDPLLGPRNGFESDAIREPEVLVWRDTFHIWYAGFDVDGTPSIGHAGTPWPVYTPPRDE